MSLSHADRILLVLLDGGWHSTREILCEVPSIVHSRISDLRKTGLRIEHRTTGVGAAGSWYRLLGSPGGETAETADAVASLGDPSSLSGGPGATLAAVANQAGPFNEPPAAHQVQPRAGSQPRWCIPAANPPLRVDEGNHAGGSLSGASAQTGREGHGRPSAHNGRELDDPSGSPPAQLPLPGVAA